MKFIDFLFATFAVLGGFSSSFASADSSADPMCHPMGGYKEMVCEVSFVALLSRPDAYDGKPVKVIGYFSDGYVPVLFTNEFAYETSDVASGIALEVSKSTPKIVELLRDLERGRVAVVGIYSSKGVLTGDVVGFRTAGKILLQQVGKAPGPWGYSEPIPSLLKKKGNSEVK